MAIQPDSGFPDEGISLVHKALACQPEPFGNFMEFSGLFQGFIGIDAKTNKTRNV